MLTIADVRDYVATLGIAVDVNVFCGKLPSNKTKSICVYNLKRNQSPIMTIGGIENSSYNTKGISLLVHWDVTVRNTEAVAHQLYDALLSCKDTVVNGTKILFIQHLHNEPICVDTDENGIFEYVVECLFYYER